MGFGDKFNDPDIGTPSDPRVSFANERTFLAWNRTALALIGGGLAASQLLKSQVHGAGEIIGLPLIVLGSVLAVAGFVRWRGNELALRLRNPLPPRRLAPALLAAATALLAVLSIVLLVISELRK